MGQTERRKMHRWKKECKIPFMILVLGIAANTYAATTIEEHAYDLLKATLWVIGVLFAAVQSLVVYAFVSTTSNLKNEILRIHIDVKDLDHTKLDKNEHERLCDRKG